MNREYIVAEICMWGMVIIISLTLCEAAITDVIDWWII